MLNEFRSTYVAWDKATRRIYSPITANASDENGRKLVVQIVNGGQVEDLTGATLHLYWETRDKAHDGLDVFEAVDLKKGEFELSYTTGMLSNHGVLNANLVLIDTVGRVVSERFKITVTEGIDNDAIQSENSFSSLTQALIEVGPRLNSLTAQMQRKIDEVSYDTENSTFNFYSGGILVSSFSATGATNDAAIHSYIDTLVTDGAIQGVTVADGSISPAKTTFLGYTALTPNVITGSYYNMKGDILSTGSFSRSEKIMLKEGETIEVRATGYLQAVSMIAVVTSNDIFIKTGALSVDSTERTYRYTATEQMEYVVVSYSHLHPNKIGKYLNLIHILDNLKEKTNTIYTPTNVDTLETLKVTNQSRNIFNEQSNNNTPNAFLSSTGDVFSQANTGITNKISVLPGDILRYKYLTLYGPTSDGSIFEGFLYDKNDNPLYLIGVNTKTSPYQSVLPTISGGYATLTIPNNSNVSYAKINYQPNVEFMVVKNSAYPSTYEPFKYELEGLRIGSENIDGSADGSADLEFLKYLISDVTIVGDSLMDGGYYGPGYTGAAIKESPPYFLEKLTDWTITDVSKNGASPISWWTDFGATTNYSKSDAVIIGLGTNAGLTDTMATDVNVGTQTFANTQTGQYARIINAFRKANPKAHIFLVKVFASSGDVTITNTVIDKMADLFDCKLLDESELFGNPVMHYNNTVHYGKVGNLHKAKLLLNQMTTHINDNLSAYEVLIDTY